VGRTLLQSLNHTDIREAKVFDISGCFVHICIDEDIGNYKLFGFNISIFKTMHKFFSLNKNERD